MKKRILDILDNTGFSKNFPTPFCNHLQSPASWVHVHPCTDAHRRNDATQLAPNRARASPDSLDSNLHISSFSQLIPGRWMEMVYLEISWNFLKCLEISWNFLKFLEILQWFVWTPGVWTCERLEGEDFSATGATCLVARLRPQELSHLERDEKGLCCSWMKSWSLSPEPSEK